VSAGGERRAKALRTALLLFLVALGFYISIYLVVGRN